MSRKGILIVAALLVACVVTAFTPAYGSEVVVPENCWPMAGGGPTRAGYTRTRPLTGPLRVDWKRQFKGPLVGEPLVWDDTIVVCVRVPTQGYTLHLLSLQTGKSLGSSTKLRAEQPPLPSLWRRRLAVRDSHGITVYRVGRMRLTRAWDAEVTGCVDLHLVGEEVTYAGGSGVESRRSGSGGPTLVSTHDPRSLLVRGPLGPEYLIYDREGNAHWANSRSEGVFVGHHEGRIPSSLAAPVLAGTELFVRLAEPMALRGRGSANTAWLQRGSTFTAWKPRTLCRLWAPPVASPTHCIVPMVSEKSGDQLLSYGAPLGAKPQGMILANRDVHADLLANKHMTVARDILYLGPQRINLKTLELYQPLPVPVIGRVVPAKESLLVLSGKRELSCLREADARREERVPVRAAAQDGQHTGHLVDLDGKIKKAKLSWTDTEIKNGRKPVSVKKYLLVRANDGTIVHAGSTHAALEGLRILIQEAEGKAYAGLATTAVKALDVPLTRKFIQAAEDRGATNHITKWTRRRLSELAQERPRKKVKEKGAASARKNEQKLLADMTDWIWNSYLKLDADAPWHVRAELLRAALTRDPQHKEAVAAVKAAIPDGVPLPKTFDAQRWLMLADAVRVDPVSVTPENGPDAAQLAFARRTWRKDVIGLRSSNLLIVTPETDPAQVAACLATGEAVCRELEKMFGKPSKDDAPLVLHLFQTKEAYLRVSAGGKTFTKDNIAEASAGHYSPRLNLSRIFLPAGEDAFAAVTETYQHELTHHWLQARCPLPRTKGRRDHGPATTGFFLVEGIAELVSEFDFDLRRGTVTTRDPRVSSLDVVAHAPQRLRHAWPWLITANQFQFSRLRTDKPVPVPMRWRVGLRRQMTQMTMFYAQAGAVAQYLYHTSADTRAQLVDLVLRYYEGTLTPKHLEQIAGLRPGALGAAVQKFAK